MSRKSQNSIVTRSIQQFLGTAWDSVKLVADNIETLLRTVFSTTEVIVISAENHVGADTVITLTNPYVLGNDSLQVYQAGLYVPNRLLDETGNTYTEVDENTIIFPDYLMPVGTKVSIVSGRFIENGASGNLGSISGHSDVSTIGAADGRILEFDENLNLVPGDKTQVIDAVDNTSTTAAGSANAVKTVNDSISLKADTTYVDSQDAATLSSANGYTDSALAAGSFGDISVDKTITFENASVPANTSSISSVDGAGFRRLLLRGGAVKPAGAWIDLFGLEDASAPNELQLGYGTSTSPQLTIAGDEQQVVKRAGANHLILSENELVDDLVSTDTDKGLTANMGNTLKFQIDNHTHVMGNISDYFSAAGILGTIPGVDLNGVIDTGHYGLLNYTNVNAPTNAAASTDKSALLHLETGISEDFQVFYHTAGNTVYVRAKNSGTWGSWEELADTTYVDAGLAGKADSVHTHTLSEITDHFSGTGTLALVPNDDMNDITVTGNYFVTDEPTANVPATFSGNGSVCTHFEWNANYKYQVFYVGSVNEVWTRTYALGSWTAWVKNKSSVIASLTSSSSTDALAANQAGVLNDFIHRESLFYSSSINFDLNASNDRDMLFFGNGTAVTNYTIGLPSGIWSADVFEIITLTNHGTGTLVLDVKGTSEVYLADGLVSSGSTIDIPVGSSLTIKRNAGEQWQGIMTLSNVIPVPGTGSWATNRFHTVLATDLLSAELDITTTNGTGTVGPSGSGAGTLWTGLDVVPSDAKYVEVALVGTTEINSLSGGDVTKVTYTFGVQSNDETSGYITMVDDLRSFYYSSSAVNNTTKVSEVFKIPLGAGKIFKYEVAQSVSGSGIPTIGGNSKTTLKVIGFGTN